MSQHLDEQSRIERSGRRDGKVTLSQTTLHAVSNHLTIVTGFVDLLLSECTDANPRRADLLEIQRAALKAAELVRAAVTSKAG